MDQNIVQGFIEIGQIHTPSGGHIELGSYINRLINAKYFQKNGTIFLILSVLRRYGKVEIGAIEDIFTILIEIAERGEYKCLQTKHIWELCELQSM